MSALLLDTTFLIDAQRRVADIDELIHDDDDVAIAAITVAELLVGVELASGRRKSRRRAFVEELLRDIAILDYDVRVATEHAVLLAHTRRTGRPRGAHDLVIAATARSSARIVVTADASAFEDLPGIDHRSHRQRS